MDIEEIRNLIDTVDDEIAELFVKRMDAVKQVADYKRERGMAVEDREREQKVIEKHVSEIEDERIRSLYIVFQQELMEISKRWQHRLMDGMCVACAGMEGGAAQTAAGSIFPDGSIVAYEKCREAYNAVEAGKCEVALLPLENSFSGEVGKVYDLIFSGDLYVNDIYAVETAEGTTRYAVLSRVDSAPGEGSGEESLLVMFTVRDEVGGLAKAINIISAYDFNMRVMRSRPMKDLPWHYYFYAELAGDCSAESADRLIRALRASCPVVKLAGRFTGGKTVSVY